MAARVPITNGASVESGSWALITNSDLERGTYKTFLTPGETTQSGWRLCNLVQWLRRGDLGRGLLNVDEDATCSTLQPPLGAFRSSRPVLPPREPLPEEWGGPANPPPASQRPVDPTPPVWSHPQDARSAYLSSANLALVWVMEEPTAADAGACTAKADVLEVYRGERSVGDTVALTVPCCAKPGTITVARDGHLPEHEGQWRSASLDPQCRVSYQHCAQVAWLRQGKWRAPMASWQTACEDLRPPPGQLGATTTPFPPRPALSETLVEAMRSGAER